MSQLRDFFTRLPAACGVESKLAAIYSDHLGKLFDYEIDNPDGAFRRSSFRRQDDRIEAAFSGWQSLLDGQDWEVKNYAHRLADFAQESYSFNAKGIGRKALLDRDKRDLETVESNFPEVAALMTVEYASTLSNWA